MRTQDLVLRREPAARTRIRVGAGVLDQLVADLLSARPGTPLVIIADARVAPLHARPLQSRLRSRGLRTVLVEFPAGERHKNRRTKERIEDELFRLRVGRDAAVIAVGGGVTCDLAGFVAATWQRGVPVVHVPTSLLAMVDAALGGKTAVNLPGGKNLVGSFHHPWGLYADIRVLDTLAPRRFREGLAEVVKIAAIADARFFMWLERSVVAVVARQPPAIESMVARCISIKSRIVRSDPREDGRRAMLNFGHTVAHALERASDYRLAHGVAVACGMCVEGRLACRRTGFPVEHLGRLERLLTRFALPTRVPPDLAEGAIVEATRMDKKARGGLVRYALPAALGTPALGDGVTVTATESELRQALAATRPGGSRSDG